MNCVCFVCNFVMECRREKEREGGGGRLKKERKLKKAVVKEDCTSCYGTSNGYSIVNTPL